MPHAQSLVLLSLPLALAACAPQDAYSGIDGAGGPDVDDAQQAAYGPDCADELIAVEVCDCAEATVSWEGLAGARSIQTVFIGMDAEAAAA